MTFSQRFFTFYNHIKKLKTDSSCEVALETFKRYKFSTDNAAFFVLYFLLSEFYK